MVVILSVGQSKVNVVVNTISDGIENHLEEWHCPSAQSVFENELYIRCPCDILIKPVVDVAKLVNAPDCGSGTRGFKSRHPPHVKKI